MGRDGTETEMADEAAGKKRKRGRAKPPPDPDEMGPIIAEVTYYNNLKALWSRDLKRTIELPRPRGSRPPQSKSQ